MLENLASDPFLGLVQRFKKLGLKTAQGYRLLQELEALKQLIMPLTIEGKRLFDLSHHGWNELGGKWRHPGRGGLEHRYWVEAIKQHYLKQEGFTFIEKDDLDLVVESYEQTLAVQVETGKSDLAGNLLQAGPLPGRSQVHDRHQQGDRA